MAKIKFWKNKNFDYICKCKGNKISLTTKNKI